MENNIQHLIWLLALYLRFIAKIHNSQDDVNDIEWVIFLVKGKKMPPIGQVISFSYAVNWCWIPPHQAHQDAKSGLFNSELTIST